MDSSIEELLNQLYLLQEWDFSDEKESKMHELQQLIQQRLEGSNEYFLLGKLYNCSDSYSIEAEKFLTKNVKIDPYHYATWNCLGNCLWKKGERDIALKCYLKSLQVKSNKRAYWDLSMLTRQLENTPEGIVKSVNYATLAIQLDLADHNSWYVLGNSLTSKFFSFSNDKKDINKAIQAYTKSELLGGSINPDLYYNRGMVLQYLLDYQGALKAYHTCCCIDKKMFDAKRLFNELNTYILHVNKIVSEQLLHFHSNTITPLYFQSACVISDLHTKTNKNKVISLRVLAETMRTVPPHNYVCCDSQLRIVLVCFYNIADGVHFFQSNQILSIKNPVLNERKLHEEENEIKTNKWSVLRSDLFIIQVFDLSTVTVDGEAVPNELIVPTVLKAIMLTEETIGIAL